MATEETSPRLVLLDIDGTLLLPDGAGRQALKAAMIQVYGTAGAIDTYRFSGYTDKRTVDFLLSEAGVPDADIWDRFEYLEEVMAKELRSRLMQKKHNLRPLVGGAELISRLRNNPEVMLGLVTGNFRSTAMIKLEYANYSTSEFVIGAFGHETKDRNKLPALAVKRAYKLGRQFTGPQVVVIGDTPLDIMSAHSIGARSIAVATGWHHRDELTQYNPHFLLDNLRDAHVVLEAIFSPA